MGCGTNTSLVLTFQQTKQLSDEIVLQRVADILGEACSVAYCPEPFQRMSKNFKHVQTNNLMFLAFHGISQNFKGKQRILENFNRF